MSAPEPDPPEAPRIEHRLHLHRWQWIGIPILLLIPILSILGVFGITYTSLSLQTADLGVELGMPTRLRYKMLGRMDFDVTNRTTSPIDTVEIAVDTAYLSRFSTVVGVPDFSRPYRLELTDLAPGETRRAMIELQGERYGRHSGEVRVRTRRDSTRVLVRTIVFP